MTDIPNQDGGQTPVNQPVTPTPGNTPPATPQAGNGDEWWNEAQQRGFKSQGDVWKSYRDAETELSKKGEEIKTAKEFEEQVTPILKTIWEDPELLKQVRTRMGITEPAAPPAPAAPASNQPAPSQPPADEEARGALRVQAINSFESGLGIDRLDKDTQREIRQTMSKYMIDPSGNPVDIRKVPIDRLPQFMESVYLIAKEKDEKLKTLLGKIPSDYNQGAVFPSINSASIGADGDIVLTEEQMKVAQRMPGGVEGYKKALKKQFSKK